MENKIRSVSDEREALTYVSSRAVSLNQRMTNSFRYVTPGGANAGTYSYEFTSILRDACAAFESFSIDIMNVAPSSEPLDINDICGFWTAQFGSEQKIWNRHAVIEGVSPPEAILPFERWKPGCPPFWWTARNKLKHRESKHLEFGSFRNAIEALAAIRIVTVQISRNVSDHSMWSNLYLAPYDDESAWMPRMFPRVGGG